MPDGSPQETTREVESIPPQSAALSVQNEEAAGREASVIPPAQSPVTENLAVIAVAAAALIVLFVASRGHYPVFHTFVELVTIVIGCCIYMIAWNARRIMDSNYLLFLGIALLFVSGLDFLHVLCYKGMSLAEKADDPLLANRATQLWIAMRYMFAGSLLIAPLYLRRRMNIPLVLLGYAVVFLLLLASIFLFKNFPQCYDQRLTPFKVVSEYIISGMLAVALCLIIWHGRRRDPRTTLTLAMAVGASIAAELSFTLYTDVYGLSNLFGHLFQLSGFYLLYRALVVTGLMRPYRSLFRDLRLSEQATRESEQRYRTLIESAPVPIIVEREGRFAYLNAAALRLFGASSAGQLVGHLVAERLLREDSGAVLGPGAAQEGEGVIPDVLRQGQVQRLDGRSIDVISEPTDIMYEGDPARQIVIQDITERKRIEDAVRVSEALYHNVVEDQGELICRFRADGFITFTNKAFSEYYSKGQDEMIGVSFFDLAGGDRASELRELVATLGRQGPSAIITVKLRSPDGVARQVEWVNTPCYDALGRLVSYQAVGRDVTNRVIPQGARD
jgi:PAS domain S-box-containing protein